VLPRCAALDAAIVWYQRLNRGAVDEIRADHSPGFSFADRRPLLEAKEDGRSLNMDLVVTAGAQFDPPELLVARERAVLLRWHVQVTGAEWTFLVVLRVDAEGRLTDFVMFDVADRGAANIELDRLTPDVLEVDSSAWRAIRRFAAATNGHDRDGAIAAIAPGYGAANHRRWSNSVITDPAEMYDALCALDDHAREICVVELNGDRRALVRDVVWFRMARSRTRRWRACSWSTSMTRA